MKKTNYFGEEKQISSNTTTNSTEEEMTDATQQTINKSNSYNFQTNIGDIVKNDNDYDEEDLVKDLKLLKENRIRKLKHWIDLSEDDKDKDGYPRGLRKLLDNTAKVVLINENGRFLGQIFGTESKQRVEARFKKENVEDIVNFIGDVKNLKPQNLNQLMITNFKKVPKELTDHTLKQIKTFFKYLANIQSWIQHRNLIINGKSQFPIEYAMLLDSCRKSIKIKLTDLSQINLDLSSIKFEYPKNESTCKSLLGKFFKKSFPLYKDGSKYKISMQLLAFIQNDKISLPGKRIEILLGPSGCGKTYKLFQFGLYNNSYMIYIPMSPLLDHSLLNDESSFNFLKNIKGMEKKFEQNIKEKTEQAKKMFQAYICARLLYLYFILQKKRELSCSEFLYSQMNSNTSIISTLYLKIMGKNWDFSDLTKKLLKKIKKKKKIMIAIDESQVLPNCYKNYYSVNNTLRSLLTVISTSINEYASFEHIFYSGTSLSIQNSDEIISPVGKEFIGTISNFKFTESVVEVMQYLTTYLDLSKCKIGGDILKKLCGRKRLVANCIEAIGDDQFPKMAKTKILIRSIEKTFTKMKNDLIKLVTKKEEIKLIIAEIGYYFKILDPPFYFSELQGDLLSVGISQISNLKIDKYRTVHCIDELLAQEVCKYFANPEFLVTKNINLLREFIQRHEKGPEKGFIFEDVIFSNLITQRHNNKNWNELDFIKKIIPTKSIPKWLNDIKYTCESFGTPKHYGYSDDMISVLKCSDQDLIKPSNNAHPDGVQKNSNIIITWAIKFGTVGTDRQKENLFQVNLQNIYMQIKNPKKIIGANLKNEREGFLKWAKDKKKIRICVECFLTENHQKMKMWKCDDNSIDIKIHQGNIIYLVDKVTNNFLKSLEKLFIIIPNAKNKKRKRSQLHLNQCKICRKFCSCCDLELCKICCDIGCISCTLHKAQKQKKKTKGRRKRKLKK